jgi:putative spermidine/putrescine transport system permease protein
VTTFTAGAQTTLPIFILNNLRQGQQLPIVNVVAFVIILLTIVPVWVSQRLSSFDDGPAVGRAAVVTAQTE